jgi:hypothetical protein
MKNIYNLVILFLFFESCSPSIIIQNKTFISGDSIKLFTLKFIDSNTCVYEQNYRCDIDEKYRNTIIVCDYQIIKNRIVLKNKTTDLDSLSSGCFRLPDSEIQKCNNFNVVNNDSILIIGPTGPNIIAWYGYIDIITIDTLYYDKGQLIYPKIIKCFNLDFIDRSFIDITSDRKRLKVMKELTQSQFQFKDKSRTCTVIRK